MCHFSGKEQENPCRETGETEVKEEIPIARKLEIPLDNPHAKALADLILSVQTRDPWEVFRDFVCMAAIAISNRFDPVLYEEREKLYLETRDRYPQKEQELFPHMFREVEQALERERVKGQFRDILGLVLTALSLTSKYSGQFVSCASISDVVARIAGLPPINPEKGYIHLNEPTCGGGSLIYAAIKEMQRQGGDYNRELCVTASDKDLRCVHMTFIQMSLYGIPGVVIHADVLTVEQWSRWYTQVYLLDDWVWRCTCGIVSGKYRHDELLQRAYYPMYGIIRELQEQEGDNPDGGQPQSA